MLRTLNLMVALAVIGWTAVSLGSFFYHVSESKQHIEHVAREAARDSVEKDILYRYWAAMHGGVYVPVTKETRPDPYLSFLPNRDITALSGQRLTLIDPASMTRQVQELERKVDRQVGHITSLHPLRPENAPDAWETKALKALAAGQKEVGEIADLRGERYYRFMSPLFMEKPCLSCHAAQGYKEGAFSGGISNSIPMKLFAPIEREHFLSEVHHFGGVWIIGIAGIALAVPFVRRRIREREDAVHAVEESEKRYSTIVNTAQEGIISIDAEQNISFVNSRMAAMLGYAADEMIGKPLLSFMDAGEHEDQRSQIELRKKGIASQYERRFLHRNGKSVRAIVSASSLIDGRNVFLGSLGMVADITKRAEVEASLAASEHELRTIFDTMQAGIILVDIGGTITFANRRMAEMLVCPLERLIGSAYPGHVHPGERGIGDRKMRQLIAGEIDSVSLERRYLRGDGTAFWGYLSGRRMLDPATREIRLLGIIQDITDLKKLESELRLQLDIVRNIPDGVYLVSVRYLTIIYANPRMEKMFGYGAGEMTGKHVSIINAPDSSDPLEVARQIEIMLAEDGIWSGEVLNIRKDGTTFWGHASISKSHHPEFGEVYVSLQRDISEQKGAEQALRISEARLKEAQRIGRIGNWEWNVSSGRLWWSEEVYRLFGRATGRDVTPEILLGMVHPDDRERLRTGIAAAIAAVQPTWEIEFRIVREDGIVRHLYTSAQADVDAQGKAVRQHGIVQDITERKQAELMVRAIAERLSVKTGNEYFRSMTEFIARQLDMEYALVGEIRKGDGSVSAISFYDRGTFRDNMTYPLAGSPCEDIETASLVVHERDAWRKFPANERLRNAQIESYIGLPLFAQDGGVLGLVAAMGKHPMSREAVERSVSLFRIMAARAAAEIERRHQENAKQRLEQDLLQSQKIESVGRLAGGVAHDINNMLTPIFGFADLLGYKLPPDDPGRSDLEEISNAANKIKAMTQQLLAFARRQTLDTLPLDINVVISQFSKMLCRTLRENILIKLDLAPSAGSVLADERQIEQVILNLAVNAQDAMAEGGVLTISTKEIAVDGMFTESRPGMTPGTYVQIKVSDTGIGMDSETLRRIFEPFFTTKDAGKGTGLGMATVYGIIKQHKGYVEVESEPRQGTTFLIYLPVSAEAASSLNGTGREKPLPGTETILVVEDQTDVLRTVKQLLEILGYRVLAASDGDTALSALRESGPSVDLLITDVIMPGSNGKELYERLKRFYPPLKVLYISGYPADVISTHGVLDKSVHFLRKPFTVHELSEKVREVINEPPRRGSRTARRPTGKNP